MSRNRSQPSQPPQQPQVKKIKLYDSLLKNRSSTSKPIKVYDSLTKGYIETSKTVSPQFYHQSKCGCTFLYCRDSKGVWYANNNVHRKDCVWK